MKALFATLTLVLALSPAAFAGQGSTELVRVCTVVINNYGNAYNVNISVVNSQGQEVYSKAMVTNLTQADAIKVLGTSACR